MKLHLQVQFAETLHRLCHPLNFSKFSEMMAFQMSKMVWNFCGWKKKKLWHVNTSKLIARISTSLELQTHERHCRKWPLVDKGSKSSLIVFLSQSLSREASSRSRVGISVRHTLQACPNIYALTQLVITWSKYGRTCIDHEVHPRICVGQMQPINVQELQNDISVRKAFWKPIKTDCCQTLTHPN